MAEAVAGDDVCPICHLLLFAPVKTTCSHLFCASCMGRWADASQAAAMAPSSLDLDLRAFGPSYDGAYGLEAKCPMCRAPTTAQPDTALARDLEARYPRIYAERRTEEKEGERDARTNPHNTEGVMVLIGNRHKLVTGAQGGNKHGWTFFVRLSRPDIVKEVRVNLHPTFRPPSVVLRRPPFEVRRLGWGFFEIEAVIVLVDGYEWVGAQVAREAWRLDWTLSFEGAGKQERLRGRVRRVAERDDERPVSVEEPQHVGRVDSLG